MSHILWWTFTTLWTDKQKCRQVYCTMLHAPANTCALANCQKNEYAILNGLEENAHFYHCLPLLAALFALFRYAGSFVWYPINDIMVQALRCNNCWFACLIAHPKLWTVSQESRARNKEQCIQKHITLCRNRWWHLQVGVLSCWIREKTCNGLAHLNLQIHRLFPAYARFHS